MGIKRRKSNFRKCKRIYPGRRHCLMLQYTLNKGFVKGSIMRHDWCTTNKLRKCKHRLFRLGSCGNVGIINVGKLAYVRRYWFWWVHKGAKCVKRAIGAAFYCCNLRKRVVGKRKTRSFGVEKHKPLLQGSGIHIPRIVHKLLVARDDARGRVSIQHACKTCGIVCLRVCLRARGHF